MYAIRRASPALQKFSSRCLRVVASTRKRHPDLIPRELLFDAYQNGTPQMIDHRNYIINSRYYQEDLIPIVRADYAPEDSGETEFLKAAQFCCLIFETSNDPGRVGRAFKMLGDMNPVLGAIIWNRIVANLYWSTRDTNPECTYDSELLGKFGHWRFDTETDKEKLLIGSVSEEDQKQFLEATEKITSTANPKAAQLNFKCKRKVHEVKDLWEMVFQNEQAIMEKFQLNRIESEAIREKFNLKRTEIIEKNRGQVMDMAEFMKVLSTEMAQLVAQRKLIEAGKGESAKPSEEEIKKAELELKELMGQK